MRLHRILFLSSLLLQQTNQAAESWEPLFNGKDLNNWVNVNGAPNTWTVKDGIISCTGQPIAALRTPKMYENFILEMEWRHLSSGGNAGFFVWASPLAAPGQPFLRAIEVQVLDNGFNIPGKNQWYTTHGDIFPIHGSSMKPIHQGNGDRCFPLEERSKSSPEWNHYRIEAQDGELRLSVNGKLVTGGDNCRWRKGYLGLESEGAPIEWRNIRIQELPSTKASAEDTAVEAKAWQNLYTGIDLAGWQTTQPSAWNAKGWQLTKADASETTLSRTLSDQAFELIVDVKEEPAKPASLSLTDADGHSVVLSREFTDKGRKGGWQRYVIQREAKGAISIGTGSYSLEANKTALTGGEALSGLVSLQLQAPQGTHFGNFYLRPL